MSTGQDRAQLRGKVSFIQFIDLTLLLLIVLFSAVTGFGYVLKQMAPVVEHVHQHSAQLRAQGTALLPLNEAAYYPGDALAGLLTAIPAEGPADVDMLRRLLETSKASAANAHVMPRLAQAHDAVWGGRLNALSRSQLAFWTKRAQELCGPREQHPMAPSLASPGSPGEALDTLTAVAAYGEQVWQHYVGCQEPRTVVINEELLHFKVDKSDQFEADPTPALQTIMAYVEKNLPTHKHMYVIGHTDDQADERYNDFLSYRRALYVVDKMRRALRERGLVEGIDYTLYPLGMGKYQLLPRSTTESLEEYRTRCRRIELSFRSDLRDRLAAGRRS